MKALFIPDGRSFSIELLAETQEERDNLVMYYNHESMSVSCEEWRELCDRSKS